MFQYASTYGIAKSNKMKLGISASADVIKTFRLSVPPLTDMTLCNKAEVVVEDHPCAYTLGTVKFKMDANKNYIHKSYLQSWKYFRNVEQDIRKQFTFRDDIIDKARTSIQFAVQSKRAPVPPWITVVGIHVRRGDYLKQHNIKYGYQLATKSYVDKAMKYFRDKYKKPKFLVFTNPNPDDVKWCKENVKGSDVIFIQGNSREVDLCALSMCNHTITTVGSFGWWGAFLANGTTIYFKDVAKNGSALRKDFSKDMSDYFYPGWIGM